MSAGTVGGSSTIRRRGGDAIPADGAPPLLRWVGLCSTAEAVGLATAAAVAKGSQLLLGEPAGAYAAVVALCLVVAGGLVEGAALGFAQGVGLAGWLGSRRRRWVWSTAVVAGLGWAGASIPSLLGPTGGSTPPTVVVLAGAAGLGLVLGGALGAVQALVLRGRVPHPWRWVLASAVGWTAAMPVVFAGAGVPGPGWTVRSVVALGAVTGLAAGAVLGVLSGLVLPSLDGPPPSSRLVAAMLGSPLHPLLDRRLVLLQLRGVVTGRTRTFPVAYAADDLGLLLLPGHPDRKRWWRNLELPSQVSVRTGGAWRPAEAWVLYPDDPPYAAALATYATRWPGAGGDRGPLVRVRWSAPSTGSAGG